MTSQQGAQEALDDLYLKLHGLSKRLEGSGLIDEDDAPEAYPAILAAMNLVWRLQREQSAALIEAQQAAPSAAEVVEQEPDAVAKRRAKYLRNDTDAGRAYVAQYLRSMGQHYFDDYIENDLAGDFACALASVLSLSLEQQAPQPIPSAAPTMVPSAAITASVMRDDGGEKPAFCLMVAYRSEKDAIDALTLLTVPTSKADSVPAPAGRVYSANCKYATVEWLQQTSDVGGGDPKNSWSWPTTGDAVYLTPPVRVADSVLEPLGDGVQAERARCIEAIRTTLANWPYVPSQATREFAELCIREIEK